jgi:hypothetical protein
MKMQSYNILRGCVWISFGRWDRPQVCLRSHFRAIKLKIWLYTTHSSSILKKKRNTTWHTCKSGCDVPKRKKLSIQCKKNPAKEGIWLCCNQSSTLLDWWVSIYGQIQLDSTIALDLMHCICLCLSVQIFEIKMRIRRSTEVGTTYSAIMSRVIEMGYLWRPRP